MILKFYSDTLNSKVLCDFIESNGSLLFTHEVTEDIISVLSSVIWFDDLPLTVPLDKLYAFLAAVDINVNHIKSSSGFWLEMQNLLGETVSVSAYRKPLRKNYSGFYE
jgi:hypothetical protein